MFRAGGCRGSFAVNRGGQARRFGFFVNLGEVEHDGLHEIGVLVDVHAAQAARLLENGRDPWADSGFIVHHLTHLSPLLHWILSLIATVVNRIAQSGGEWGEQGVIVW